MDIVENNTNENIDIEDLKKELIMLKKNRRNVFLNNIIEVCRNTILFMINYVFIKLIQRDGFLGSYFLATPFVAILDGLGLYLNIVIFKSIKGDLKRYNSSIKSCKEEISKSDIIDKIKEINKEEVNGINIDKKQQQLVNKLLGKLKNLTSEEEYKTAVDEIFNERVPLEEDEYTVTEENHASIEPGSIAHAYSTNNAVKKKVLVRR